MAEGHNSSEKGEMQKVVEKKSEAECESSDRSEDNAQSNKTESPGCMEEKDGSKSIVHNERVGKVKKSLENDDEKETAKKNDLPDKAALLSDDADSSGTREILDPSENSVSDDASLSSDDLLAPSPVKESSKTKKHETIKKEDQPDNVSLSSSEDDEPNEESRDKRKRYDGSLNSLQDNELKATNIKKSSENADNVDDDTSSKDNKLLLKTEAKEPVEKEDELIKKNDQSDNATFSSSEDDEPDEESTEKTKECGHSTLKHLQDDDLKATSIKKLPKSTDKKNDHKPSKVDKSTKTKAKKSVEKDAGSNKGGKKRKINKGDDRSERKRKKEQLRRSEFNQALDVLASTLHQIDPSNSSNTQNELDKVPNLSAANYFNEDEYKVKISNRVELINRAVSVLRKSYAENEAKKTYLAETMERQTLLSQVSQNPLMDRSAVGNPLIDAAIAQQNREQLLERLSLRERTSGRLDNLGSLIGSDQGRLMPSNFAGSSLPTGLNVGNVGMPILPPGLSQLPRQETAQSPAMLLSSLGLSNMSSGLPNGLTRSQQEAADILQQAAARGGAVPKDSLDSILRGMPPRR